MSQFLVFIIGVVVGGVVVWLLIKNRVSSEGGLSQINVAKRERVEENKAKIVAMLREKGSVTNNDIERAVGVSDATATRYLQELEDEGKIEQVGTEGRFVKYRLK